jgi:hypothetical protein
MPPTAPVIETIRKGLIAAITDFVQDAGFNTQINLIVELVYELAGYREEDVPFFPTVYVVKRTDDGDTLSVIAPGAERIFLKSVDITESSGARILKDSAALADGGWSIYVDVTDRMARYGLFRSEVLPISLSSAERMADPDSVSGSALLIRNCARNCVELMASDGNRMELGLTAKRPATKSVTDSFSALAIEATRSVLDENRKAASLYLQRLLAQICQRCHGTMIVVLPTGMMVVPEAFHDGVILEEPINLLGAFHEMISEATAATLARLSAHESLLRGMIQSDGITVLSADGRVLGFRVFVKPDEQERHAMHGNETRGGARSRAFELLKLRVGESLSCAFFRSQDGETKCEVRR